MFLSSSLSKLSSNKYSGFLNEKLGNIYESSRAMYKGDQYNKSPKKENRQQNNGNFNIDKSKRGTYNFGSNNQQGGNSFITRDEMMITKRKKPGQEEKIVWTNPK